MTLHVPLMPFPGPGRHVAVRTLGMVGAGVLATALALLRWYDALDQAAYDGTWPPLTLAELLGSSARWALSVTIWCAVCWVAVVATRPPRRGLTTTVAVSVVVAWTALGARSAFGDGSGWWLPWWPGPVSPTRTIPDLARPAIDAVVVAPGVLMPVVLLAAVAATCMVAARQPGPAVVRPRRPARAWGLAAFALGLPATSIVALSLYPTIATDDGLPLSQRVGSAVIDPGAALLVAAVAAALLVGRGPGGTLVAVAVGLSVTAPRAVDWYRGGDDYLLATAALGALAIAVAGLVGPTAAALTRLDAGRRPTVPAYGGSVAEGADADDRART